MTDNQEEAEPWDMLASALGSLDDIEDDQESVDIQETFAGGGEGDDPFAKVPLGQAQNLLALRQAAEGVLEGRISKEKFLATLRPMLRAMKNGLELVRSEAVQSQLAALPPEQGELFRETEAQIARLNEGLTLMNHYGQSDSLDDIKAGMEVIESAFQELDEIQDEAIDVGREDVLREEASS